MSEKVCNFAPDFEREICPGGGMVDAVDSKSAVSNGVRVQVPPGVLKRWQKAISFALFKE